MDPHQRYTTEQVLKHSWIIHRDQLPNDQPNINDTSHVIKVKQAYFCAPSKCLIHVSAAPPSRARSQPCPTNAPQQSWLCLPAGLGITPANQHTAVLAATP